MSFLPVVVGISVYEWINAHGLSCGSSRGVGFLMGLGVTAAVAALFQLCQREI